jgi:hypothetical protein
LFSGQEYKGKKPAPEGARVCNFVPFCTTHKYPRLWTEVMAEGKAAKNSPSTKAAILELMFNQAQKPDLTDDEQEDLYILKTLRYLSVLGKFLSTYLTTQVLNDYGCVKDGKDLASNIHRDGRVRTHFHQTSSTGRYRSFKPNLQTSPKKQETAALAVLVDYFFDGMTPEEYKRRTDDDKNPPDLIPQSDRVKIKKFKSCYVPAEGYVLMEADFKSAELYAMGYLSGDPAFCKILDQNRDIHAEIAAKSFQFPELAGLQSVIDALEAGDYGPYKAWDEHIKLVYEALRTSAKAIIFGLCYGRSAGALAREIGKVVKGFTKEQAQQIIDTVATSFPVLWAWLQEQKRLAIDQEFVVNAFGRPRYFTGIGQASESDKAAAKREASNAPVQGTIADLLARAGVNLYRFRYHTEVGRKIGFKVILPVHDAFYIECPSQYVEEMKAIIQICMSDKNRIPGTGGRKLDVDVEVFPRRLGEKPQKAKKAV